MKKGVFIVFEGPEGSGKSTHSKLLYEELVSKGFDAVHTREPGDTLLGGKIRDILLDRDGIRLGQLSELLLFEADRAQHVEEVIGPALDANKIVICDRFNAATFAYQGYGLGLDMDLIHGIDSKATGGVDPDLVILFSIDVKTGLERASAGNGPDRMEKRKVDFHRRVLDGYLKLAAGDPDTIKVIEVEESIEKTYEIVREKAYACIERYKRPG